MSRPDFAFEDTKPVIADRDLLDDVRAVAAQLGVVTLPQRLYRLHGRYSTTAIKNRFGSWNTAVAAAGLTSAGRRDIGEGELFENLQVVWAALGVNPASEKRPLPLPEPRLHEDRETLHCAGASSSCGGTGFGAANVERRPR